MPTWALLTIVAVVVIGLVVIVKELGSGKSREESYDSLLPGYQRKKPQQEVKLISQEDLVGRFASILQDLGADLSAPGIKETPKRVIEVYKEMLEKPELDLKSFPSDVKHIVVARDIPLRAFCEHHLLPFFGTVQIGYLPDGKVLGISKFTRLVEFCAKGPTLQEYITDRIADILMKELNPKGVIVVTDCQHTCMTVRGVKSSSRVTSSAVRGYFQKMPGMRDEFFNLLQKKEDR